jgi:ParB family chromosome partitioning protein
VQPRTVFDDELLRELSASIAQSGILQPVLVRREAGDYLIIAGERRWRAAKLAGLKEIPVVVKEANEGDAFTLALVENLQREDLRPIEMAEACRRLIDDYGLTQEQVAERIGKSRSAVANLLRLLKLEPEAQAAVEEGKLSEGHARQLVGMPAETQREMMQAVIDENLSVRQTEALAREQKTRKKNNAERSTAEEAADFASAVDVYVLAARRLEAHLGVPVIVRPKRRGGSIEIAFGSSETLEALLDALTQAPKP